MTREGEVEPRWKTGKKPPAKKKPLAWKSAKRKAEAEQREEVRRVTAERAGGRCQGPSFDLPGECSSPYPWRPELETNEVRRRGTHPGSHLDASDTVLLCQLHHDAITSPVGELREHCERVGLIVRAGT